MSSIFRWKELKQSLLLAFPLIVGQLGQVLLQVTDSVMVGRLGTLPLAASAFASSLYFVPMVFGFSALIVVSTRVAHHQGAGDFKSCGEVMMAGVWISVLGGTLLAALLHIGSFFLFVFGQEPGVEQLSRPYLLLLSWSTPFILIFQAARQFLEGLSLAWAPMGVMFVGVVLNILLNWILIFGHWGAPALGLEGAGWATLITRFFMGVALLGWILKQSSLREYFSSRWFEFPRKTFFSIGRIALPTGCQGLFEVAAFSFSTVMMGWLGASWLAAHQIVLSLSTITYMVTLGLAFAAGIRVAGALGRGARDEARRLGLSLISIGALVMSGFGVLLFLGRDWFPTFYSSDPEVIEMASSLVVIAAFFQIADATQGIAMGALRGLHDIARPTLMAFGVYWVLGIPGAYWIGIHEGRGGESVWTVLAASLFVLALGLVIRFVSFFDFQCGSTKAT